MPATFFDLLGTLVVKTPGGYVPQADAATWITSAGRAGVLCNAPSGQTGKDVRRIAEEAGVLDALDPALFVVATDLPCPLPDRRAFGVAAALAELPVDECVYVSTDTAALVAAAAAGMRTLQVGGAAAQAAAPAAVPDPEADPAGPIEVRTPGPALFARSARNGLRTPVDVDEGPVFVLRGRVVTMDGNGTVLENGRVAISKGRIAAVAAEGQDLPPELRDRAEVDTGGTIYPGLIDLHNHFVYNVLPLWVVPKRYENRSQWPRHPDYAATVTLPVRTLASYSETARALVRYVEGKALIGGVTTGQGIRTKVEGSAKLFRGGMRNVEETDDARLPEAGTRVPDLYANAEGVKSFKTALESRTAYFYHLAEGVDDRAHQRFTDLQTHDLIARSLVGIHCLGLGQAELAVLAGKGAKAVWSPFSNLLLYGKTLDPAVLKESGILFSLGCDWSPTGSKNLLEELKVARFISQAQDGLTSAELVRAVTSDAARIAGWDEHLGSIRNTAMADVVVIRGAAGDPYDALIDSTEADIRLVVVHGRPRYGDRELMEALSTDSAHRPERVQVAGLDKAFDLFTPGSVLNDIAFGAARALLETEMQDLPGLREKALEEGAKLNALGVEAPPFVVELDNEFEPTPDDLIEMGDDGAGLMADWSKLAHSVPLDPPEVGAADYWQRIQKQPNIDAELKEALAEAYGA